MSKSPPAFQLYAADFDMDTGSWTISEVGAYFRLLMHQWVNGEIPDDIRAMARIARCDARMMHQMWGRCLAKKFVPNGSGGLHNCRMEEERLKQQKYRESQQEAGKRGAEKRWKTDGDPNGDPNGENMALQSSSLLKNKDNNTIATFGMSPPPAQSEQKGWKNGDGPIAFEEFWSVYPARNGKKLEKAAARKYFLQKIKDVEVGDLFKAVGNYASSKTVADGYARDAIRFLRKDYWKDWIKPDQTTERKGDGWFI